MFSSTHFFQASSVVVFWTMLSHSVPASTRYLTRPRDSPLIIPVAAEGALPEPPALLAVSSTLIVWPTWPATGTQVRLAAAGAGRRPFPPGVPCRPPCF